MPLGSKAMSPWCFYWVFIFLKRTVLSNLPINLFLPLANLLLMFILNCSTYNFVCILFISYCLKCISYFQAKEDNCVHLITIAECHNFVFILFTNCCLKYISYFQAKINNWGFLIIITECFNFVFILCTSCWLKCISYLQVKINNWTRVQTEVH